MSKLLLEAIERARTLPVEEQERLGALFMAEVEQALADAAFDALLESRPDVLEQIAADAEAAFAAGLTEPLDIEKLFGVAAP